MQRYLIWKLQGCATSFNETDNEVTGQEIAYLLIEGPTKKYIQFDSESNHYQRETAIVLCTFYPETIYDIVYRGVRSQWVSKETVTIGVNRESLTYRSRNPYQNARLFEYREAQLDFIEAFILPSLDISIAFAIHGNIRKLFRWKSLD